MRIALLMVLGLLVLGCGTMPHGATVPELTTVCKFQSDGHEFMAEPGVGIYRLVPGYVVVGGDCDCPRR